MNFITIASGTVLVKDIVSGGISTLTNLTAMGDRLFFTAGATGLGRELWVVCGARSRRCPTQIALWLKVGCCPKITREVLQWSTFYCSRR
jgi:hypothetical protein